MKVSYYSIIVVIGEFKLFEGCMCESVMVGKQLLTSS